MARSLDLFRSEMESQLEWLEEPFSRAGMRITGFEVDSDNGRPFPDVVVYLRSSYVERERELPYYLGSRGVLEGASQVALDLYAWSTEVSEASGVASLPLSRRDV